MSHNYSVTEANYDATAGAADPKIVLIGTVDGFEYPFSVQWSQIQTANTSGGVSAVRQVLGAIMLNSLIVYRIGPGFSISGQQKIPVFHADSIPEPITLDSKAGWVTVPEATAAGSWTA